MSLPMLFFDLECSYHTSVLSSQFPLRKLIHILQVLAEISSSINNITLLQKYFHFNRKKGYLAVEFQAPTSNEDNGGHSSH